MEKLSGVVAVLPFGDTHRATVLTRGRKPITEDEVKKVLEGTKLTLEKLETRSLR